MTPYELRCRSEPLVFWEIRGVHYNAEHQHPLTICICSMYDQVS